MFTTRFVTQKSEAPKPTLFQIISLIICGLGLLILSLGLGASVPIPGQPATQWVAYALLGFLVPFGTAPILRATAPLLAIYALGFLFGYVLFGSNLT
ncbi:MAG: hypothetical protein DI585_03025 [Pseudomonas fluorescens]|nr:MAG: hypothetical protein DI585_03025 [Pseudomonas fluorescens]